MERLNRIKEVLWQKGKTQLWLAEKIKINPATLNKYCNNKSQPTLSLLNQIANVLGVDILELINSTKKP